MNEQVYSVEQLAAKTAAKFQQQYGRAPRWVVAAPGRVNLIGEHTDYNDGYVLPMAIERYTVVAADGGQPGSGRAPEVRWHCARTHQADRFPGTALVPRAEPKHWSNYVRGVFAGFQALGVAIESLDVLMDSSVPLGGGLSSSAALEVATATLLEVVSGHRLDPVDKALLCQKAEHEYAGMPCGIMDQFTSVLGRADHLLLLDCRSRKTELVPMNDPEICVLITNTNVKHELVGGEYAQRREQCETAARSLGVAALRDATLAQLIKGQPDMSPVTFERARHVITEIQRTVEAADRIRASDWPAVGDLMYASHLSLKQDYQVSCAELDALVEIAREIGPEGGMIGCRMTGGGFGGCTVSLVRRPYVEAIGKRIQAEYPRRTGAQPSLFLSRPAAGATVIKA